MHECEMRTGLFVVSRTSKKVFSETWAQSMIIPSLSISRTTDLPNSVSPPHVAVSSDESAHLFVFIQVRVMHLAPRA